MHLEEALISIAQVDTVTSRSIAENTFVRVEAHLFFNFLVIISKLNSDSVTYNVIF